MPIPDGSIVSRMNMTSPLPETKKLPFDPVHLRILQEVANAPNCTISHVVSCMITGHSENSVRTGVRNLLSKRYLDGGKATSEIRLRITSNGRVALDKADM